MIFNIIGLVIGIMILLDTNKMATLIDMRQET